MKKTIIALSVAALVAVAPAALALGASSRTSALQHKVSKKYRPGVFDYAPRREMRAGDSKKGYPGAFGYAPGAPNSLDRDLDASRQAGGGGGGGGM